MKKILIPVLAASFSLVLSCGEKKTGGDTEPPTAPSYLAALVVSGTWVNLTWTAATDDVGVAGYSVLRDGVLVGQASTPSYSDSRLAPDTRYCYDVFAYDGSGNESGLSNTVCVFTGLDVSVPTAPSNLSAAAVSPTRIGLTWTASSDNIGVAGYRIFRDGSLAGTVTGVSYHDHSLAPDIVYCYTVLAYDAAGNESAPAGPVCESTDMTAPGAPGALTGTVVSGTQVNLSWTASSDNVGVTGYRVYRGGAQIGTAAGTTYSDTTVSPDSSYCYTVRAQDAAGNLSESSPQACKSTDVTPPSTPGGLTATPVSRSRIDLSWTASTDNVAVVRYVIYRGGVFLTQTPPSTLSWPDQMGLAPSTQYCYRVRAYDAADNWSESAQDCGTTLP